MQAPTYTAEHKARVLTDDGVEPSDATRRAETMSDRQFASTYDQGYRRANPLDAATRSVDKYNKSLSHTVAPWYQDNVAPRISSMLAGTNSALNSGYLPASGLGATAGLGIAAILQAIRNRNSGEQGGYGTAAAIGLGGGALLGALSHYYRNQNMQKTAAFDDPFTAVTLDSKLSNAEKQELLRALGRLNTKELQDLKRQLATALGAGAGAIVLRFLVGKGLISTAIGAVLGGVLGRGLVPSHKLNSLNQYY